MKTLLARIILINAMFLLVSYAATAQTANNSKTAKKTEMKTYVIEREIPNAGKLSAEELKAISQKSCGVLKEMGSDIEWLHSYVTGNKLYCVYKAENPERVREHAKKGGFPCNSVAEVKTMISPATAN